MKKILLYILLPFVSLSTKAQLNNWQPSPIYAIDKIVINQLKTGAVNSSNITERDLKDLQNKIIKNIKENTPDFSRLDSIKEIANIKFLGISSHINGSDIESVLVPLQGYLDRQYVQKEFKREEVLIQDFKSKIIDFVNSVPKPTEVKTEIVQRIKELPDYVIFETQKATNNAIDKLNTELSAYLSNKLGADWNTLKNKISADAEKIVKIPMDIESDLLAYLKPRLKVIDDIKYFTGQVEETKKVYERLKNNDPVGAFKALQKNDLYTRLIESSNMKELNNAATGLSG